MYMAWNKTTSIDFNKDTSMYYYSIEDEDGNTVDTIVDSSLEEIQKKKKETDRRIISGAARESVKDLILSPEEEEEFPSENPLNSNNKIQKIDYGAQEIKIRKKSDKIIDKLLKFYLSEEFIEENEYITAKQNMDSKDLTMILQNMEHIQRTIDYMMSEFDAGNLTPRMFETFATVQKSFIELLVIKNKFMLTLEEHTKKLRSDYDFYATERKTNSINIQKSNSENKTFRGTKGFLENIEDYEES